MTSGGAEKKHVLTITVTYKSAEWTAKSLRALAVERARSPHIVLDAVIVDNASGDSPALRRLIDENGWGDWATLITAERNGGFAYGNNVAFAHAYALPRVPDFFYLLNPDAEVRPGAVEALVKFFDERPDAGLAASSIEEANGELWPFAFRFPSLASEVESGISWGPVTKLLQDRTVRRQMATDAVEEVDWFPGASMMLRREVVDAIGGMDESYFLYFEETDYLLRAKEAGFKSYYVPQSRVAHAAGQSTGVTARRERPARLPGYWFESRRRYFAKNHGFAYAAATDVAAIVAYSLGAVKRIIQRRPDVPSFVPDLLRHSVLWPKNRGVEPVRQFKPGAAG
jgi:GT2 family glycosyltransferase